MNKVKVVLRSTGQEEIFEENSAAYYNYIKEACQAGVDWDVEPVEEKEEVKDWAYYRGSLKTLKIPGFVFNPGTINEMDGLYYDKEGDEDCWIEINKICNFDSIIVSYVYNCATIKMASFDLAEGVDLSGLISGYIPKEMK